MLSKLNDQFSFENSRFGIQKSKEATARIALWKELKNSPCIFTLESSFAGVDIGKETGFHLTTQMLEALGRDLCRTLLIHQSIYVPPELQDQFKVKKMINGGSASITESLMQELSERKELLKIGDGDSSSGSDSAPSDDNLDAAELIKNLPTVDKTLKKKLKQENDKKNEKKTTAAANRVIPPKKAIVPPPQSEPQKRLSSPQKKPEPPKTIPV